jgi:hypothetical protein
MEYDLNNLSHEEFIELIEEDNKNSIELRKKIDENLNKLSEKDRDFIRGKDEESN